MIDLIEFIENKCSEFVDALQSPDKNKANNIKIKIVGQVCSSLPKASQLENIEWFEIALRDDSKKWFVLEVFKSYQNLPKSLLVPLVKAAMDEKNVSLHGYFIEPCIRTFGEDRVSSIIKGYIAEGNEDEKMAAKDVLYWVPRFKSAIGKT